MPRFAEAVEVAAEVWLSRSRGQVVPGEELVTASGALGVEGWVEAGLLEGPVPAGGIEALVPPVEAGLVTPGGFDDRGQPAVTAGEDGFENGPLDVVRLDAHGGARPIGQGAETPATVVEVVGRGLGGPL